MLFRSVDDGIAEPAPETKTEMDKVQAEHLEGTVLFTAPPAVSTAPNSVFLCESPSSKSRDPDVMTSSALLPQGLWR